MTSRGSRAPSSKLRFDVFTRDGFRCVYCGRSPADGAVLEADHLLAWVDGGETTLENLVTACQECNAGKHAAELTSIAFLTATPPGAACSTRLRVAAIGHYLGYETYRLTERYLRSIGMDLPPSLRTDSQVWNAVAAKPMRFLPSLAQVMASALDDGLVQ